MLKTTKKILLNHYVLLIGFVFITTFICIIFSTHSLAMSNKLSYSGRLLDKNGSAINTEVSIKFSIYTQSSGGTILWTETKTVDVENGYFSSVLGESTTLDLDFSSDNYYLGIKVNEDSEMTPRKYIGIAPYSINSDQLDGKHAGIGANNILQLNSSGAIDISGEIKTSSNLLIQGTSNIAGTFQLGGTTITASASEINYVDGVTSAIQNQIDNRLSLSGGTLSGNIVFSGSQTVDGVDISTISATYLALSGGTLSGTINLGNFNITNVAQLALTPRSDGSATEGYVYYDSDTDAFYGRTAADWVNFAGDGGDITSVTAGNGLTGGGIAGDVTLNIAAGDGTITVAADSIIVGTINTDNITDGSVTAADLGVDSVDASELSSTAIVFGDIEAGDLPAAIDAAKIGGGAVSNTEYGYLDGVSSAIQTQFTNKYDKTGGELSGNITFAGAQTVDGVDISGISTTYLALAGGTMAGLINMGTQNISNIGTIAIIEIGVSPQYFTTLQGGNQSGDITYTLPTGAPLVSGYVLSATTAGVMSWVAQSASNTWTDAGSYLFPAGQESLRIYDSAGVDYFSIASGDLGGAQIGTATTASGEYSTAMGFSTTASGKYSIAMGDSSVASGWYDVAIGQSNTASGSNSLALGYHTTASNAKSTALGTYTTASGTFSTALGAYTTAQAYDSVVLGRYNVIEGSTGSWVATDPLFVIGNGATAGSPANALTVLKNGNTTIAGNFLPSADNTYDLGSATAVYNDGYFTNVLAGTGDAMTITANLASTWSTSSGILTITGDDGLILDAGNGNLAIDPGTQALYTLDSASEFIINATASTTTAGVLDLNVTTATDDNVGFDFAYDPNGSSAVGMDFSAMNITIQTTSVGDDNVYGIYMGTTLANDSAIDHFMYLNNSDDSTIDAGIRIAAPIDGGGYTSGIRVDATNGDYTNGILVQSYGVGGTFSNGLNISSLGGAITDAIDVSGSNITNAVNLGANKILGTTATIDFNDFDVSAAGALTLSGKITNTNYAGSSAIDNGSNSKSVANTYVSSGDRIFVSFTADPGGYWWISAINNGANFVVSTSAACGQVAGCTFDYWIVK